MNKRLRKILGGVSLMAGLFSSTVVYAQTNLYELTTKAGYSVNQQDTPKSSVVIDADSGQILWEENAQEKRDPASLSKLMSAYLVFEAIQQGKLSVDATITATQMHQNMSQLWELSNTTIIAGQEYSIRELLLMTLMSSSNVASMMLAEKISQGDWETFVSQMNQKAADFGMNNTRFADPSGATFDSYTTVMSVPTNLQHKGNISTARDLAILSYRLLSDYPSVLDYTKHVSITVGQQTSFPETLQATNYSLEGALYGVSGVDGLKTGSSPEAGYNYIATAKRENLRVIEVILGVSQFENENGKYIRHYFGNALLEHIFQTYEKRELVAAGTYAVGDSEVAIGQSVEGVVEKNVQTTFSLEHNQLTIYPSYDNIFGKKPHIISVVNLTEQRAHEERLQQEQRIKIITFVALSILGVVIVVMIFKKKRK
ncbi:MULTISPECIES: serine hydrolase [unclassified Granulicatella]|uniref:serine hydrolase n=1 Tax=unclassified Granulicatella TaxID=2630493 RepID=UPI0014311D97|nr:MULTISPECIES: serine hydrolase [unclassified Granulicatella]MBF0780278.1 D-alanyl-D-alanine carboxypeptidase [Granulicatella sp. 19428wC4_WM01]